MYSYVTDGNEIYRRSFAMIREESDLGRFDAAQAQVADEDDSCGWAD